MAGLPGRTLPGDAPTSRRRREGAYRSWRQGKGIEPSSSASQHHSPVLKTGPGTSPGRPAAVRCTGGAARGSSRGPRAVQVGAFDGRAAAAAWPCSSPQMERTTVARSCGMAARGERNRSIGE